MSFFNSRDKKEDNYMKSLEHVLMAYYTATYVISLCVCAVTLSLIVILVLRRHTELLRGLDVWIDILPFFAGLIPLTWLITEVMAMHRIIGQTVGDPRVFASGIGEMYMMLAIIVGFFFLFLGVWLIMRMLSKYFVHELDALPI